jgi:hypothetical protein
MSAPSPRETPAVTATRSPADHGYRSDRHPGQSVSAQITAAAMEMKPA